LLYTKKLNYLSTLTKKRSPKTLTLAIDSLVPIKCAVKAALSRKQSEILNEPARRLRTSETLRVASMDCAEELSLMRENLLRGKNQI
jgi:hypothetical protein